MIDDQDPTKTAIEALKPNEVTEFNRHLKEIARQSRRAAGLIVVGTHRIEIEGKAERVAVYYWDGKITERFGDDVAELPYVYVSVKAAQRKADDLNADDLESAYGRYRWQVMFWKHPDYYMGTQHPISRYLQITGCRFEGSPRR